MTADSYCGFNVIHLLLVVVSIIFRIESGAGCRDENDLKNMTTAVGSSVELPCNITNIGVSIWNRGTQNLAIGTTLSEQWQEKYSLRIRSETKSSSSYFVYNLMINNVTEDLSGLYTCQEEGCTNVKLSLFVEVPLVLWLETEHSHISNSINVIQNKETIITCKAIGGKPSVSLAWEINGVDEIDGVTSDVVADGVSSILKYRANQGDRNVTCKTSGQFAISLRSSVNVNVQYPPTCHILVHNESSSTYTVTCVCVANPEVLSSVILVNNLPYEINTVSLQVTSAAKIYCRAKNEIGDYKTPVKKHTPPITSTVRPETTFQLLDENQIAFLKLPWSVVFALSIAIIITATALIVAIVVKNISPTTQSTRDTNESQNRFSLSTFNQPPSVSESVFVDTSDNKYETRIFQDEISTNELSHGGTELTVDATKESGKPEYFQILG